MESFKSIEQIRGLVSKTYNVDITQKCRELRYTRARSIYFKLCVSYIPAVKLIDIAASVNLSHCTVSVTLQKFEDRLKFDKSFKRDYDVIQRNIMIPEETLKENDALRKEISEIKQTIGNEHLLNISKLFTLLSDEEKVNLEYKLNSIYEMNMLSIKSNKK